MGHDNKGEILGIWDSWIYSLSKRRRNPYDRNPGTEPLPTYARHGKYRQP